MPYLRRQGCRTRLVSTCAPASPGAARVVVLGIARTNARTRGIVYSSAVRECAATGNLGGITRQIVERDEAGLDRPLQCCASHRPALRSLDNSRAPRWNALNARPAVTRNVERSAS